MRNEKSIEELKSEINLKIQNKTFDEFKDIKNLPIDNDLREFVCKINPYAAYSYAFFVDKCPHELTRKNSCKDFFFSYLYSCHIDTCPHELTRKNSCKSPDCSFMYAIYVDKCSHELTRKGAYKDPYWKEAYIEKFGE